MCSRLSRADIYIVIDLSNSIPSLLNYLNPAGQTTTTMTDDEAIQRLTDAFWQLRMNGADWLAKWTCTAGIITTQVNPGTGFPFLIPPAWYTDNGIDPNMAIVQAICLFAAYQAIVAQMLNVKTQFAARAGAVSIETQQSATTLQAVLKALKDQVNVVQIRLTDLGFTEVAVFDSVIHQTDMIAEDMGWFVRGGYWNDGGRSMV